MKHSLIYYGNPLLRQKASPILSFDQDLRLLAENLIDVMFEAKGVGLAAPQVGVLQRLFIAVALPEGEEDVKKGEPKVYINPELSNPGFETNFLEEGCLSIPKLYLEVERPSRITIKAYDLDGNPFVEELTDFAARCIMHENDHLNGVLFIDRVIPKERKKAEKFLRDIKKRYQ
ncbi:MAG: def [Chlamydiales bacterium]|jgi:peptide deformylase|nr:def [Chlamydiales bacterium]